MLIPRPRKLSELEAKGMPSGYYSKLDLRYTVATAMSKAAQAIAFHVNIEAGLR